MGLFDKIKEPIILKEDSNATKQLETLEKCLISAQDLKTKTMLEKDIATVKAGIFGEETILFELKNSHIPMFVLHDLYLESGGLSAQIDYLIITRRRNFVVECKNLYGNITVNNGGDFIRMIGNRKEGIYSPITQSKRHLELIKQMREADQKNIILKSLFKRHFYENYRSVVVLANPKTILNARFAPSTIKEQVIRADQLIEYIQKVNQEQGASDSREKDMERLANYFLSKHQICPMDYLGKYRAMQLLESKKTEEAFQASQTSDPIQNDLAVPQCPRCGSPMVKRKATKGTYVGQEFWGCSNYPVCRGIINIMQAE